MLVCIMYLAITLLKTLLKKRFRHRCFPVNFAEFSRAPFFYGNPPVAASLLLDSYFSNSIISDGLLSK